VEATSITPKILADCDDVVLTNAIIGVRDVSIIDGRTLPKRDKWAGILASVLGA
jgi:branched-subunit amino acid aminotransferase/4-amino-4-deoxychorismate lyase